MSLHMAEKSGQPRKEATYVNISQDVDSMADAFGRFTLEASDRQSQVTDRQSQVTDRQGQVTASDRPSQVTASDRPSQVRVYRKDKSEVEKEKADQGESDYVNMKCRAPVNGEVNMHYLRANEQFSTNSQAAPATVRSGQKRVGMGEQIYHNWIPDFSQKLMKPGAPIDPQRQQMIMRNGGNLQFGTVSPSRVPEENDDRIYGNSEAANHFAHSQHYANIPAHQAFFSPMHKGPMSEPREHIVPSPFQQAPPISDYRFTDYVLNDPAAYKSQYTNKPTRTMINVSAYQHESKPTTVASSSQLQDYLPAAYKSPQMHGAPCQISPNQRRSSQLLSPCTPQSVDSIGSPPSQYSYSTQHSPGQQTFSQSNSPLQNHPYSNVMFSPPHQSPTMVGYPGSVEQQAVMANSPADSQTVPSPLSYTTDVSSPGELSLYPHDNMKLEIANGQQQTSLNEALDSIFNYQTSSTPHSTAANYDTKGYISTTPISPYVLPSHTDVLPSHTAIGTQSMAPQMPGMVNPAITTTSGRFQSTTSVNNGSVANVQVANNVVTNSQVTNGQVANGQVTNGPSHKLPLPPLVKPLIKTEASAAPVVLLFIQQPTKAAPVTPKAILPKPSGEAPVPPQPKTKTKGRSKKNAKNKSVDPLADNARGSQSNFKTETIKAKAMVGLESDEALLKKENGETVLHRAIALKKQPVIVALLEAMQKRPALAKLVYVINDKDQTPLFLAVHTGQPWLAESLVKMNANCNTLCQFEVCDGQVEHLSPLHYACKFGDRCLKEVKAMLASKSTNVDTLSRSGMTALHLALWNHGHMDGKTKKSIDSRNVIKALLEAGANCTIADNKTGKTALHFAVENGSFDMTRLILESKCQMEALIDQKNYDHRTALHFAVSLRTISEENKMELVKYLISKGASKSCKDKNKLTPRELVSPTEQKILEVFNESMSPARSYNDDDDEDTYQNLLMSP